MMGTVTIERKKIKELTDAFEECHHLLQSVYDGSLNKSVSEDKKQAGLQALTKFSQKSSKYSKRIERMRALLADQTGGTNTSKEKTLEEIHREILENLNILCSSLTLHQFNLPDNRIQKGILETEKMMLEALKNVAAAVRKPHILTLNPGGVVQFDMRVLDSEAGQGGGTASIVSPGFLDSDDGNAKPETPGEKPRKSKNKSRL